MMKKRFTKSIPVILVIALSVTISGCNSANPDTSQGQQTPVSPSEPTIQTVSPLPTQAEKPTSADDDPDVDHYYNDYESLILSIFFQEYYYLDGDGSLPGLYFWDDGDVEFDGPDVDSIFGEYDIDEETIVIYVDGEEFTELIILDWATLLDFAKGDIYALEGALDNELETGDYYYLNGDEDAGNLWFWSDGDVDIEDSDGDIEVGKYEVRGVTVVIELHGDEVELYIVNSYILQSEHGDIFIRVP